jgi:hypothetical protein
MMAFRRIGADGIGGASLDGISRRRRQGGGHFESARRVGCTGVLSASELRSDVAFSVDDSERHRVRAVRHGKQQRWPHMLAGIVFSIYPYFTPSILVMVVVGVALRTGLWVAVQGGW